MQEYADAVTAIPGESTILGLVEANEGVAIFIVPDMTTEKFISANLYAVVW